MIFSEIYGTYYLILEELLARAAEGGLTRSELEAVIRSRGFGESILTIPEKLADGSWPLLTPELQTPLHGKPDRPLTTLEKRWMKALHHGHTDLVQQEIHIEGMDHAVHVHRPGVHAVDDHLVQLRDHQL